MKAAKPKPISPLLVIAYVRFLFVYTIYFICYGCRLVASAHLHSCRNYHSVSFLLHPSLHLSQYSQPRHVPAMTPPPHLAGSSLFPRHHPLPHAPLTNLFDLCLEEHPPNPYLVWLHLPLLLHRILILTR